MRVVLYKWFRLSNDGPTATPIEVVIKIVSSMGVERTDRRGWLCRACLCQAREEETPIFSSRDCIGNLNFPPQSKKKKKKKHIFVVSSMKCIRTKRINKGAQIFFFF